MDPYAVLADRYAKSTLPDLAHSALPGAPQQPYVERRKPIHQLIAALRRRAVTRAAPRPPVMAGCGANPVPSPRTIPGR